MSLPKTILETIQQGQTAYNLIIDKKAYQYTSIDINCANLPDPVWKPKTKEPIFVTKILDQLPNNNRPCLYYFEILNSSTSDILKEYITFKNKSKHKKRASPALKKSPPLNTDTLYLGKIQKDMRGRLYVHLGYYYVKATAGLQLFCWAKNLKLKLRLHIYSFDPNMYSFVSPLELPFARDKKPLIGKH